MPWRKSLQWSKDCKQVLSICGCDVVCWMCCWETRCNRACNPETLSGQLSYIRINTVLTSFEINLGWKASAQSPHWNESGWGRLLQFKIRSQSDFVAPTQKPSPAHQDFTCNPCPVFTLLPPKSSFDFQLKIRRPLHPLTQSDFFNDYRESAQWLIIQCSDGESAWT